MVGPSFKDAISSGDAQIGLWQALGSPVTVELCAAAGFDWLLLDAEHGPSTIPSLLAQLQAMNGSRSHPIVRLPNDELSVIKQVLDIGAMAILVPFVESAEQAKAVVAATRYAPEGNRGLAAGQVRASLWGRDTAYINDANDRICVLVQIESRAGLDNVAAIAATEGVDGVFIGPADLAASLGHRGRPTHPEILAAIDGAIDRVKAAGKAVGLLTLDEALAHDYVAKGCSFVAVGTDVTILARGVDSLIARFRDGGMTVAPAAY
jgi:4-hydroxy-2-oxoheptanedioate aldolase